jgi:polyisoprenoid-binding protein YceI
MHHRPSTRRWLPALALALLAATAAGAETTRFSIDKPHSTAAFSVRHFVTQVPGRFNDVSGTIAYDPAKPEASKVEMTIQAASIDTNHDRRDTHLRSADFFDVETFPTLTFTSTAVQPVDDDTLQVTGDLTIHGVTKRVTVPVEVLGVMGDKAGFATEFTIDRKDYGIVWNRALDTGGALLGDEVKIEIAIEADRDKPEEAPAAPAASE